MMIQLPREPSGTLGEAVEEEIGGNNTGQGDMISHQDMQRQKRLELNRKAAHESRKRKKIKLQQLSDNLQSLRAESLQLSAQNDTMRKQLCTPQPTKYTQEKKALEAENAVLRQALLTALQGLSEEEEDEVQDQQAGEA